MKSIFLPLLIKTYNITGLEVCPNGKRGGSKSDGGFKVPKVAPLAASIDEEEKLEFYGIDEVGSNNINGVRNHSSRRYRDTTSTTSEIIDAGNYFFTFLCF